MLSGDALLVEGVHVSTHVICERVCVYMCCVCKVAQHACVGAQACERNVVGFLESRSVSRHQRELIIALRHGNERHLP